MLSIPTLMATLAQQRPVFHAEADFQHAFAWEIHRVLPEAQVRLEVPVVFNGKRQHTDKHSDPLTGRYPLHWTPYAQVGGGAGWGSLGMWR